MPLKAREAPGNGYRRVLWFSPIETRDVHFRIDLGWRYGPRPGPLAAPDFEMHPIQRGRGMRPRDPSLARVLDVLIEQKHASARQLLDAELDQLFMQERNPAS
jgi:hypothetical protein